MYTLTRSPYSFSSSPSYVSSIWPNGHRPPKEGGTHKHKRKSLTKGNAITSRATELLSSLFFQGIEKSKETAHIELGGRGTSHFPLQSTRCATLFLVPFFKDIVLYISYFLKKEVWISLHSLFIPLVRIVSANCCQASFSSYTIYFPALGSYSLYIYQKKSCLFLVELIGSSASFSAFLARRSSDTLDRVVVVLDCMCLRLKERDQGANSSSVLRLGFDR